MGALSKRRTQHGAGCHPGATKERVRYFTALFYVDLTEYISILSRLTALGWGDTLAKLGSICRRGSILGHKQCSVPRKLTDKSMYYLSHFVRPYFDQNAGWATIEGDFVSILEECQLQIAAHERDDVIRSRIAQAEEAISSYTALAHFHDIFPPTLDLLLSKPFCDVIQREPIVDDITPKDFAEAVTTITAFSAQWRRLADEALLLAYRKSHAEATLDDLRLASCIFRCLHCSEIAPYPHALAHECSYHRALPSRGHVQRVIIAYCSSQTWRGKSWVFQPSLSGTAKNIMRLLGLNADTTTTETVLAPNFWVAVETRSSPDPSSLLSVAAYPWERAVRID